MSQGVTISSELFDALTEWRQVKIAWPNRPPGTGPTLASLERIAEVEDRLFMLTAELSRKATA